MPKLPEWAILVTDSLEHPNFIFSKHMPYMYIKIWAEAFLSLLALSRTVIQGFITCRVLYFNSPNVFFSKFQLMLKDLPQ